MKTRIFVIFVFFFAFCVSTLFANPFGVMLGGRGMTTEERIEVARDLGVVYFRPWDIDIEKWDGHHAETQAFLDAGFKIIMTVRNNGSSPLTPTTPPQNISAYKKTLGEILDQHRPELLVVENEETSELFYSGSPQEYKKELKAACGVSHERGIPCTNGGIVSKTLTTLVWNDYVERRMQQEANDFALRAFTRRQLRLMNTPEGQQLIAEAVKKGKDFLDVYKKTDIDYVNFHWYLADAEAMRESVDFLERETGHPAICNEMGQRYNTRAYAVNELLPEVVALKLPYAVWFSLDRRTGARALQNRDGSLRRNGKAFKKFIEDNF